MQKLLENVGKMRCIILCCCVLFCLCCFGQQDQAKETVPAADGAMEFILHPVQEGYLADVRGGGYVREKSFSREPHYAGDVVIRHTRILELNGQRLYIPVAYDVAGNTCYIDWNMNDDLTDDGPGLVGEALSENSMLFPSHMIETTHNGFPVRYEVSLYSHLQKSPYREYDYFLSWKVVSGWEAEVEIAGKRCLIGISDNMDGVLDNKWDTFRFDHERHRQARLPFGKSDEMPLPRWLHFEGKNYRVTSEFRVIDNETVIAVNLTPVTEDLMEISFEGQFVSRVLLKGVVDNEDYGEYLLLDWPTPAMKIPKGSYTPKKVYLLDSFGSWPYRFNPISPDHNRLLKAGGPLKKTLSVTRRGDSLAISYELRGIDNAAYIVDSTINAPRIRIFQGEQELVCDKFEYG